MPGVSDCTRRTDLSTASSRGRRAVIAGVATSDYPYLPDMSEHGVHAQAAKRALADAGITVVRCRRARDDRVLPDVRGRVSPSTSGCILRTSTRRTSAGPLSRSWSSTPPPRSKPVSSRRSSSPTEVCSSRRWARRLGTGGSNAMPSGPMAFEALWGNTLVGSYALAARRHMHEFGTTPEQLAEVAVTMRAHAAHNPMAQYRDPITVDDVVSSRLVADPLHKLDCCVISDGGGACVVTTAERAARPAVRAGLHPRRRSRHHTSHQHLADARPDGHGCHPDWPEGIRPGRDQPSRCRRGTDLRLLHHHRAPHTGGSRLLRQGRERRLRLGTAASGSVDGYRPTPTGAGFLHAIQGCAACS